MKTLDWNPVRKGAIYCSPKCGMGCTHKAFKEAHKKAENLRLSMDDPEKWEVNVWENLGWHYTIKRGEIEVHDYSSSVSGPRYSACHDHQYWHDGKAAQEAVNRVATAMRQHAKRINKSLKSF